ncbi:hypothetical protein V7S57_00710 [Caulobacter sp. CCNWLY153]|uniref:Uncharacterized protein n=1 Tax=Caulobacter radicis TaxID=2172650 RepID=A0A2T9J7L7_9CAUL|nr:hypothetical protein [Caulobacter radicis]PVM77527.1 hypothetical protein DDF65_16520 [Caulobacter radicis]
MEIYEVEPSGQDWRVIRAGRPILSQPSEHGARTAAAVLNAWAQVEEALQLTAPPRSQRAGPAESP